MVRSCRKHYGKVGFAYKNKSKSRNNTFLSTLFFLLDLFSHVRTTPWSFQAYSLQHFIVQINLSTFLLSHKTFYRHHWKIVNERDRTISWRSRDVLTGSSEPRRWRTSQNGREACSKVGENRWWKSGRPTKPRQSAIIIGGLGRKKRKKERAKGGTEGQPGGVGGKGQRGRWARTEKERGEAEKRGELRGTMKSLTGRSEHNAPWSTPSAPPTTDPPHNPTRIVRPINIVLYRESWDEPARWLDRSDPPPLPLSLSLFPFCNRRCSLPPPSPLLSPLFHDA